MSRELLMVTAPPKQEAMTVKPTRKTLSVAAVLFMGAVALLVGAACGQSPEAKKQKALSRGEQYLKDGKVDEAIIEFRTSLQVDENFVPAVQGLGRAYVAKSWYGDAAREFQRAKKLSPDSLPIAVDFGRVLVQLGAWKEAEEQAAVILSKEPRNQDGLYIRSAALLGQGHPRRFCRSSGRSPQGNLLPIWVGLWLWPFSDQARWRRQSRPSAQLWQRIRKMRRASWDSRR